MGDTTENLQQEIDVAFAWRPYPGDDNLGLREPGPRGDKGKKVNMFLRGKDWRELTLESLLKHKDGPHGLIPFMSSEGFAYYLPAFLKLSLDFDNAFDVASALVGELTFHAEGIAASLTPAEKRVVIHVLEFLASEYDGRHLPPDRNRAQAALEYYWGLLTEKELEAVAEPTRTVELLQEEIEAAFAWRSYPGDDSLASYIRGGCGDESEEAKAFLQGKNWRELTLEAVLDYSPYNLLPFLSCQGLVYYLPAFLKTSLDIDSGGDDVAWALISQLSYKAEEVASFLTPAEKQVVVHVLEFLANSEQRHGLPNWNDAQKALEDYWGLFTDEELESKDSLRAQGE